MRRLDRGSGALPALGLLLCSIALGCGGGAAPETTPRPTDATDPLLRKAGILRAEDRREVDRDLLAALSDNDPAIRAMAALAVGRIGDPAYEDRLDQALADERFEVRSAAAFALGLLGAPSGIEALAAVAGDPAAEVRTSVADALGLTADPQAGATLLALMNDEDPSVLAGACFGVARIDQGSFAVNRLIELGVRSEPELQFACTYALSEFAATRGRLDRDSRLLARARMLELAKSPYSQLRRLAARGLNVPTKDDEAAALGKLVEDPDFTVRIAAVDSLSFPGAPIEPFISKALEDTDERVFLAVVEALGRMRGADVIEVLARIIVHDTRLWIRERAVVAVGRASSISAQMANGLSRAEDAAIRRATATLLVGRLDEETTEFATRLYADEDPSVRAAIIPAFAEADGPLERLLASAIVDQDPQVRAAAARAAGLRLSDAAFSDEAAITDAIGVLRRLWSGAQDPLDVEVALETMRAAGQAPAGTAARELLEQGLDCPDRTVRLQAIAALQRVYDEDHSAAAGPAAQRPIQDYVEILRWAEQPRAAVVTIERPGFVPGRFTVRLDTRSTPLTSWNFSELSQNGYFDGQPVYRVVPDTAVYTGAPRDDGGGGPGYAIRDELRQTRFWPGTLGMSSIAPDRAGSAWFVTLTAQPQLMARSTAFANVIQNLPGVVARLLPHDRVVSVRIYAGDGSEPLPPVESD